MKPNITNRLHTFVTTNKKFVILCVFLATASGLYSFWPDPNQTNITSSITSTISSSTLTNSPVILGSPGTSVTYQQSNAIDPGLYSQVISVENKAIYKNLGGAGNFYNYKIILPDNSEAYLKEFLFNKKYEIAQCNTAFTECEVYNKFKFSNDYNKDICWKDEVQTVEPPSGALYFTDNVFAIANMNTSSCFKIINPYSN